MFGEPTKPMQKKKGLEHYRIKSDGGKHVIKGLYHIQNVNGLHSRLKQWIDHFKGVATKYLDSKPPFKQRIQTCSISWYDQGINLRRCFSYATTKINNCPRYTPAR